MSIATHIKHFDALSNTELLEIVRARFSVFVGEQHILEPDFDDVDYLSYHLYILDGKKVIAYARMFQGDTPGEWHIGRMLTVRRGSGLGSTVLSAAISEAGRKGGRVIRLHAQTHAIGFYERHGFTVCSPEFEEAGILHREMELYLPQQN